MPELYVDNFRGFQDTYIPLKDVNFLVGENSTGKTSILSLIRLLNSIEFWFSTSFNSSEINFGQFSEIVNKGQKSFSVGFFNGDSNIFNNLGEAMYMSFIKREGIPAISELAYISDNNTVKIDFENSKYKVEEIDLHLSNISGTNHFFRQWIEHVKTIKKGFTKTKSHLSHESVLFSKVPELEREMIENGMIRESKKRNLLFQTSLHWVAPIRAKPKRIYDSYSYSSQISAGGEHFTPILKDLLTSKKDDAKNDLLKYILPFGEKSGLFKKIEPEKFGTGNLSPFEMNIILFDQPFKICNVGYGVSQILPILVNLTIANKGNWFLIQQPEIHLHPKAQAAIGELIYNANIKDDFNFIIETHSEYLINRFRMMLKENKSNNPRSQILFFERENNVNSVHSIEIQNNGKYPENLPASFYDFFIEEDLKVLGI